MLAQALDIGDQVPGGVLDQTRARAAASAAPLIENHDAVMLRVEELPCALIGARAGTAMQEHGRLARRIAALFVVNLMHVRDTQEAVPERFDRRIQPAACAVAQVLPRCLA